MMRRLHSDEERNIPATCTIKLERGGERKKDGITVIQPEETAKLVHVYGLSGQEGLLKQTSALYLPWDCIFSSRSAFPNHLTGSNEAKKVCDLIVQTYQFSF